MALRKLNNGDRVVVTGGRFEGVHGLVIGYFRPLSGEKYVIKTETGTIIEVSVSELQVEESNQQTNP